MTARKILVVGAGIFGVCAARCLQARGNVVTLIDPGPLPHPDAASTDINKFVRMDYGPDEAYTAWMETAFGGWDAWNRDWPEPLYHETGVLFLARTPMAPGGFEYESYTRLLARGHRPERLDAAEITRRYPAWHSSGFVDGYYNPDGGYAETGRVLAQLLALAGDEGVRVRPGQAMTHLLETDGRVVGVAMSAGERLLADEVLVAAGARTPYLLPWLRGSLRANGMPVVHLKPEPAAWFADAVFPPFAADISRTGYYGFPTGRAGVVKMGHHGTGRELDPATPGHAVSPAEIDALRAFLKATFPELAAAPIVHSKICFYSDTWDGHFWIDRDPERPGLTVAAGDSGHAIKFAPVLGDLIADALEGRPNPHLARFRWRPDVRAVAGQEAARAYGITPEGRLLPSARENKKTKARR